MIEPPLHRVVQHIRRMAAAPYGSDVGDATLLERFISTGDESAFSTLVQRHGPMVRGACKRLLRQPSDVDDAFQATFLLLVRKARSIRNADSVASWLYGVAYRVARHARSTSLRHRALSSEATERQEPASDHEVGWRELCTVLDAQVQSLSENLKAPIVLCYLEGRTRDQAAKQLGCSPRTIDRRLEKGRSVLRARLARRGVTFSASLLASAVAGEVSRAALTPELVRATIRAGKALAASASFPETIPVQVVELIQGVLHTMLRTKVKMLATGALALAGIVGSGVLLFGSGEPCKPKPPLTQSAEDPPGQIGASEIEHIGQVPGPVEQERSADKDLVRLAKDSALTMNNLKQLGLAMHLYHDTHKHFPGPANYDGPPTFNGSAKSPWTGKALLSWRVALLPFLDEVDLYNQFKLNEPWDSPNNKKLLDKMPRIYRPVRGPHVDSKSLTYYQIFVGEGAGFEKHRGIRFPEIQDGTSNTIMIVEAGNAVPWTKPEDLPYGADEPIPELTTNYDGGVPAAFFDGSVRMLLRGAPENVLRNAITRAGGELLDYERLQKPADQAMRVLNITSPKDILGENQRLKLEYAQVKRDLEDMRILVQEMSADPQNAKRLKENARLRQQIKQMKRELEELGGEER